MRLTLWLAASLVVTALIPASATAAELTLVGQFGGVSGSGPGQFANPDDLAVDSSGNVYVPDGSNNRVQKFTATGQYLTEFGTLGTGAGQLTNPNAVAVDSAGNVYVADRSNHRVMQFNSAGGFVRGWGWSVDDAANAFQVCTTSSACEIGTAVNSATNNGGFSAPQAIAVDAAGVVYVSEFFGDQRVQRFTTPAVTPVGGWGSPGSGPGQFARPVGLALDSTPNVFVADRDNARVQKFSSTGGFLTTIGSLGSGEGQLNSAEDVAVDPAGNVFVADSVSFRIQKFTADGAFLTSYDRFQPGGGGLRPAALAFSPQGDLYVLDSQVGGGFRVLRLREPSVPVLGRSVNVERVSGTVLIGVPARGSGAQAAQKGMDFVPLTGERQIPVKSFLDTRRGRVQLTSATKTGGTQSGEFYAGLFQVLQARTGKQRGITEARLKGGSFNNCTARALGKRASTSRRLSRRSVRRLRTSANGRFRSRGRYSAATVRGTVWTVTDRCDGTLTQVKRGKVAVRDFRRKRTIVVRAGKSYLARAGAG